MKEERNALQKEVFPKLRKLCIEHGFRFQAIDLRWGVSEEAGLDQQTMKICLEEIERSQRVSPKPNFIVLLGDRYGWRPLPHEIPADEFEEIKSVIKDADDRKFLFWEGDVLEDDQLKKRDGWYCLDENAVPPVYCLKPRLVDYGEDASDEEIKEARKAEYKDWEDVEKRLKSILLNAIDELGWDKDDYRRFKYESSATEQEIIKGVLNLPEDGSLSEEHVFSFIRKIRGKKGIPFDDHSKDFFDFTGSGTIDASAEEKLVALKSKIDDKLPSSNIFDYETEWEGEGVSKQHIKKLCEDVYSSLEKVINEQIGEFEDKDPLDMEIGAHKEFGEERCKFFIGRENNRAQIKNYLENPNPKPLIVYGESGSGKSALMAQVVEDSHYDFYKVPADNVIVRFISATPESSDMRSLLESLSRQITKIYGEDDSNIPTEYNDLVQDFKERLNFATAEKPLFIFLDALDQLSDLDSAHNLTWIPDKLPENVHIIVSTLKNIFESSLNIRIPSENVNEVKKLEKEDGRSILKTWLKHYQRKITNEQKEEIISKFEVEGLPLYLKLAFEESKLWKSYTPIPQIESDIKWMINNLFERLSRPENHGDMIVSRSLSYLSAAKNGLTEDEMLDILALDEDVFSLTKKFHEPTEDKLPVALWSRLYFDLEPYLTERSADETSLLAFYHGQLGEVAGEKYLNDTVKNSRHQLIAQYFYKQDLNFKKDEERVYNVRKVSELPYHQTYGECWKHLEKTLCDLRFVEAKCSVNKTYELICDYELALELLPEAKEEKKENKNHEKRVEKYTKDIIAYAKGEILQLDIIPSVKPWSPEKIKSNTERMINNTTRLNCFKSFYNFVNSRSHTLTEFGDLEGFFLQEAFNFADSGPIAAVRKIIKEEGHKPLVLRDENWQNEFNPHPALIKTLECHKDGVYALAVTFDKKMAITGGQDKTVKVWDLVSGEYKTLEGHSKDVMAVAVTPDGKTAVSGSRDKTVMVWDLVTGENKTLKGHTSEVNVVAVTPDGKMAVTGSRDGAKIIIWDLVTGENMIIGEIQGRVESVALTPDGKKVITANRGKYLMVWDLVTGENKTLKGHTSEVSTVAVTPDGKTAVSGSRDKTVMVWDLVTGENKTLGGHTNWVNLVAVTPDGKMAVTGSHDGILIVWDLENYEIQKKLESHAKTDLVVTPDGRNAVSGSFDGTVKVWDLVTGENQMLEGHTDRVSSLVVTPDGRNAVSGSFDGTVKVWDLVTGENKTLEIHKNWGNIEVAVTPDGKTALSSGSGGALMVWDLKTGKNLKTIGSRCGNLVVTPDGKKAVVKFADNNLMVWDLVTGENQMLRGHTDRVSSLVVTPDGRNAVSGSWDKTVKLWDLNTGENLKSFGSFKESVNSLVVTPDGKKVVIGGGVCNLMVWDLKTGENQMLEGHTDKVTGLVVTPDGRNAVSGSWDGTVMVWDLVTGENKTLEGHTNWVNVVAVTFDGKIAITGSRDKTVRFWDLENGDIISVLKEEGSINSLTITNGSFVSGSSRGDVIYSHLVNINLGLSRITARRIWLYGMNEVNGCWDKYIKADCPSCGKRFKVHDETINKIREVEKQYQKPDGRIADEAGADPRLISECPECNKKLKFNPFIVDNSDGEFCDKDSLIEDLGYEKHVVENKCDEEVSMENLDDKHLIKKIETTKKKKSKWKFWK